jgi:hypothetical protein
VRLSILNLLVWLDFSDTTSAGKVHCLVTASERKKSRFPFGIYDMCGGGVFVIAG